MLKARLTKTDANFYCRRQLDLHLSVCNFNTQTALRLDGEQMDMNAFIGEELRRQMTRMIYGDVRDGLLDLYRSLHSIQIARLDCAGIRGHERCTPYPGEAESMLADKIHALIEKIDSSIEIGQ